MKINFSERDKILDEIAEELYAGEIEPDEITCRMLANKLGVSYRRANAILNERVDRGLYTSRYVRNGVGNNRMKAYRKVKND